MFPGEARSSSWSKAEIRNWVSRQKIPDNVSDVSGMTVLKVYFSQQME
jgi:hypothetical protein